MKRKAVPQCRNIRQLMESYLISPSFEALSEKWRQDVHRIITKTIIPKLGRRKLDSIRRGDLILFLEGVVALGPTTAIHTKRVLTRVFNWAFDRELIQRNPATRLPLPAKVVQRDRVFTSEEIAVIWDACEDEGGVAHLLYQMVLATGQRPGELKTLKWEDIDGEWVVLAETKNQTTQRAYIGKLGKLLIDRLRTISVDVPRKSSEYVFPAVRVDSKTGYLANHNTAWTRMRERMSLDNATCYDLRRTCATNVARGGVSMDVVGRILNHTPQGVTSVYQRYGYEDQVVSAIDKWHESLLQMVQ